MKIGIHNTYTLSGFYFFHSEFFLKSLNKFKNPDDEIFYFTENTYSFAKKKLAKYDFNIVPLNKYYNEDLLKPSEFYTEMEDIIDKSELDVLFVIHNNFWNISFLKTTINYNYVYNQQDKDRFNAFKSMAKISKKHIFNQAATHQTKVIHIIVDPYESKLINDDRCNSDNIKEVHFYDYMSDNLHDNTDKCDTPVEYMPLFEMPYREQNHEKNMDFAFSCFLYNNIRKDVLLPHLDGIGKTLESTNFKNEYVFNYVLGGGKQENTIPYNTYRDMVYNSKYTMILPSGNPEHFTYWLRLYQAVNHNTVPLIYETNKIERLKQTHPHWFDFIINNDLIVTSSNIGDKINNLDYESICKNMREISARVYSDDMFSNFYKNDLRNSISNM